MTSDRLERYLDGLLDEAERAAFEAELAEDPALRAQASLQEKVDGALAAALAAGAPDPDAVLARARSEAEGGAGGAGGEGAGQVLRPRWIRYLAPLVAAAVLAVVAGLALQSGAGPEPDYPTGAALLPPAELYQGAVAQGFAPQWVCETDEEFATYTERYLGRPLALGETGPDVEALGLSTLRLLSPQTLALLARVDGEPVLVLVDRVERDRALELPPEAALTLHRREADGLVLYELTPLAAPRVFEALAAD